MCYPASFIVTKDQVFWSRYTEFHEEIIDEFGLREKDTQGNIQLVWAQLLAPNYQLSTPSNAWQYSVVQDLLPSWYDAVDVEKRVRKALPQWCQTKVVGHGQVRTVHNTGQIYICGGVVKTVCGGEITLLSAGTVRRLDGGRIRDVHYGGFVGEIYNGAIVDCVCGGSVGDIYNGRIERIFSGSIQKVHEIGKVRHVYGYNEGSIVHEVDGGIVERVHDGGIIRKVYNNGTVEWLDGGTVCDVHDGRISIVSSGSVQRILRGGRVHSIVPLPNCSVAYGGVLVDHSDKK